MRSRHMRMDEQILHEMTVAGYSTRAVVFKSVPEVQKTGFSDRRPSRSWEMWFKESTRLYFDNSAFRIRRTQKCTSLKRFLWWDFGKSLQHFYQQQNFAQNFWLFLSIKNWSSERWYCRKTGRSICIKGRSIPMQIILRHWKFNF